MSETRSYETLPPELRESMSADWLFECMSRDDLAVLRSLPVTCGDGEKRTFYEFVKWEAERGLQHASRKEFRDLVAVIDLAIELGATGSVMDSEDADVSVPDDRDHVDRDDRDEHVCGYPCDICDD